jgi:hypothetical protein
MLSQSVFASDDLQVIQLNSIPSDSIKKIEFLLPKAIPTDDPNRFKEKIIHYPQNFKIKKTYQFKEAQQSYRTFKYMLDNESYKEEYLKEFGEESFNFVMSMNNLEAFDCIISACLIEDDNSKTFLVFDENNDEDFSNDKIQPFKEKIKIQENDTSCISYVESNILIEYFNGKTIIKEKFPFIFLRKTKMKKVSNYLSHSLINVGNINFNNKSHMIAILQTSSPKIEYNKYDFIWIDLNNNEKFEKDEDYWDQIYIPFTFNNIAYKIVEVDRFGKFVKIKKCKSEDIPPIAVGLPAPSFRAITADSLNFELKDLLGELILLDFWGCNSNICLSNLSKINEKYKDIGLKIVSNYGFGDYRRPLSPENKNINIDWIHLQGHVTSEYRQLYQVGSFPTSILIDKDGKIVYIERASLDKIDQYLSDK